VGGVGGVQGGARRSVNKEVDSITRYGVLRFH
jgi:hypothetical protein